MLVGEGETCKVTDFGMARDVQQENIYERKTKVFNNRGKNDDDDHRDNDDDEDDGNGDGFLFSGFSVILLLFQVYCYDHLFL